MGLGKGSGMGMGMGFGFGDRSSGTWRYGEMGDRIDSTQMSDCDKGIE